MDQYSMALGKEPIMHNGKAVGYVSSANFGYSIGKLICYGYVPIELAAPGTELSIEYFGKPQRAVVSDEPLFDKKMERLKG